MSRSAELRAQKQGVERPAVALGSGGAEAHARSRMYEYRSTASLVLTTDSRPRDTHEPSGEAETLRGKVDPKKFGDKVLRGEKPKELEEKLTKAKDKREKIAKRREEQRQLGLVDDGLDKLSRKRMRRAKAEAENVLSVGLDQAYYPRTKETRGAYEALLSFIRGQVGDQPQDVLRGAADEVLGVLKGGGNHQNLSEKEKQKELSSNLGVKLDKDTYAKISAICRLITDYKGAGEDGDKADDAAEGKLDDELGVAVEFEADDEEEDDDADGATAVGEIIDPDDDDADELEENLPEVGVEGDDDGGKGKELDSNDIQVQDIDAYWLQREITKALSGLDANEAQNLAEQVLSALAKGIKKGDAMDVDDEDNEREVENSLVRLLDFTNFELIKKLMRNRSKIVWLTLLARAKDSEERQKLEADAPQSILDELHATRASARERQRNLEKTIREEARKIRDKGDEPGGKSKGGAAVSWAPGARKHLDLDDLAFTQGGHFMANKKCELPEGSFRSTRKGYEEVVVPALKPKPFGEGEKLRSIKDLPEWAHPAFEGMKSLNRIQSRVCETALFSPENMLVCAPTGAGKTNIAMLTILHQLGLVRQSDDSFDLSSLKMIYVAPMKALVAELVGNLGSRLKEFGVKVNELTGDHQLSQAQINETQIIVTTPEKFDIITRKAGERTYTQLVRLVIIDEIHLLHDSRGPVLEAIVARLIRQVELTQQHVRIVGLSATLPNYVDVSTLLRINPDKGLFFFDSSYRPCPLQQTYIGITVRKPLQRFQLMNEICYEKTLSSAGKHQVLIFVHSRKETAKTARSIRDQALAADTVNNFLKVDGASKEILQTESESAKNADLKDLLPYGFAIHHAGLTRADRTLVEDLFSDGHVQVLVSTATLAWGVNLPAHSVIIKGTQVYNPEKGAWDELSPLDILQMFGRAGRPQFDTFGEGTIITGHNELQYYLSLLNQQLPIESQLLSKFADIFNAEVVLGTITSAQEAVDWLGYTYLYIRMLKNPQLYCISDGAMNTDEELEAHRADLVHSAATTLERAGLIKYDRRVGSIQYSDLGRIASHYYITYTTAQTFAEHLKPSMSEIEIFRLFSLADEFKFIVVREEEKMELARLLDRVPIPVKESIEEPSAKVNVLLQAYISNLKLDGLSLMADMTYVTQSAGRLMRALFEIALKRRWAALVEKTLSNCKMVARRMWGCQSPLRQFKGLPSDILKNLERKDLSWDRYYDLTSQELGELVRMPKMGRGLHRLVHQFPRLELSASIQPITRSILRIDLTITPDFKWDDALHGTSEAFWIFVEDCDSEHLLHSEPFILRKSLSTEDHTLTFTVPITEPLPPQYFVRIVSDKWLACESTLPISFRHLILPEKFLPPTELLDLQPLPVSALRDPKFENLFSPKFSHFNPIQTQVFQALYHSDDNVLVSAPAGSGKTICGEFAILRLIREQGDAARAVYVAPKEAVVEEIYSEWKSHFGENLNISVARLREEPVAESVKILDKSQLTICGPEKWDMLSRRWRQRKAVQNVKLFIFDEIHLLGNEGGATLEIIVSRARYVARQLGDGARIVALSAPLANARDVGDWIGASSHGLFNFHPSVRPVPLDVHIQGLNILSFETRLQAMMRPTYIAVSNATRDLGDSSGDPKPSIVFVPTRKYTRLVALELATYAAADSQPRKFLHCEETDLEDAVSSLKDPALVESLRSGIAFFHDGLSAEEKSVVRRLFDAGAVQVIVVAASNCWGLSLSAAFVVVMGTQAYDSNFSAQGDFQVADLLQMLGRAGRPGSDTRGKALVFCNAPRKEYYKKFLLEPLPLESHLDGMLHDHLNAEIVTRTVESKQDAVDYITWTLYYRRISQNPNYYQLQGVSHRHVSDHLSDLIETIVSDLETSKCVSVEEDMDLAPLNLGMISSYYYIKYTTLELFSRSLQPKTKLKGLLEILSAATEFETLPVRPGEEDAVRKIIAHAPVAVNNPEYTDPHTKANALIQAHLSRQALAGDMSSDKATVVRTSKRLVSAMVDVISSSGWLKPALVAMELCQSLTQALWHKDSVLMQLPHFDKGRCELANQKEVESLFDILDADDDVRESILDGLAEKQQEEVAEVCNSYPNIELSYDAQRIDDGDRVLLQIKLERDGDLTPDGWWLVVGVENKLLAIKKVGTVKRQQNVKLEFDIEDESKLALYFMSDTWMGADQEYEIDLDEEAQTED